MTIIGRNPLNIPEQLNGYTIQGFWNIDAGAVKDQPAMAIIVGRQAVSGTARIVVSKVTANSLEYSEWISGHYFQAPSRCANLTSADRTKAEQVVQTLFKRHDPANADQAWVLAQLV